MRYHQGKELSLLYSVVVEENLPYLNELSYSADELMCVIKSYDENYSMGSYKKFIQVFSS